MQEKYFKTELIENYIKENKISKIEFCKRCKLSIGTLNKVLSNQLNFKLNAIFKIARVLNIEIKDICEK